MSYLIYTSIVLTADLRAGIQSEADRKELNGSKQNNKGTEGAVVTVGS